MSSRPAEYRPVPASTAWAPASATPMVATGAQMALGAVLAVAYILALGGREEQLALVAIAAGALLAVVSPAGGLAMFAVIMSTHETELLAPIRVNAVMAGSIALGCLLRLPLDRVRLALHPGVVLLVGYVLVSALSLPPALNGHPPEWTSSAANELLRLTTGVALFLSGAYLFRLIRWEAILGLALGGATLAALLAAGDFFHVLPFAGLTGGLLSEEGGLRASGGFSDPNFLGLFMTPAAVLALGLLFLARGRRRLALLPVVILLFVCVAITFSRGTFLGAVVGVTVLIGTRSRPAALVFAIAAGFMAVTLYPAFLEARLGGVLSPDDAFDLLRSEISRTAVAQAALAMFASAPIFGVGFGVFHFLSPSYTGDSAVVATYSHNQYLNILAEQGLVGVALVFGIAVLLTVALVRSRSPLRGVALAIGAAYLVLSLFINSTTSFQGSSLLWLVMAAALNPRPSERSAGDMEA
jgi:O-antigen ligase